MKNCRKEMNLKYIKLAKTKKIKYLCVGCFNTVCGYLVSIYLFQLTGSKIGVLGVGIISNIFSITLSFLTYKIIVFRTQGNWISEYIKTYLVYGVASVIGIAVVVILVRGLSIKFWIAQGVAIILVTTLSYISHSRFTFKRSN